MRIIHLFTIAFAVMAVAGGPAAASVLVTVDKSTQQMTVEVDGELRWTWPVSTGQLGHDTPSGRFTAFRMEADHFSKEWDDAPMPHSIFFTMKGHAIHGYLNTSHIGSPASHGCVRLAPENAAKLYALVEQQGLPNTKVVLTGDVRLALARRGHGPERSVAVEDPEAGASRYPYRRAPSGYGYGYGSGYGSGYGYRPAPSYYPPRYQPEYYRPFP